MGDYFNINNDLTKKIKDLDYQGNLNQEDIDAFEKNESLFNKFITEGEKDTLTEKEENGEYKSVSYNEFNNFINKIANQYGIKLDSVSDDANIMFKFLDENGDGILDNSELSELKNYDSRGSKSNAIDGYTIGHYFHNLNESELKSSQKANATVDALRAYYESEEDKSAAIEILKSAGLDSEQIAEITGKNDTSNELESALNNPIILNSIDGWINSGMDADTIIQTVNEIYGSAGLYESTNDDMVRAYVEKAISLLPKEDESVSEETEIEEAIPEEETSETVSDEEIQSYADFFNSRISAGKLNENDINVDYIKNKIKDDFNVSDEQLTEIAEQIYEAIPKG